MSVPMRRAATVFLVLAVTASTGCSWLHRSSTKLYASDPASRPLEVPPELDVSAASATGASASTTTAPSRPTSGQGIGFVVAGTRDEVFNKVGDALAATSGVTIASRAQVLGAFDVNYEGANFLVRVSAADAGAYVSAVDPRGLPAQGDAPRKLVDALKGTLGGR